MTSMHTQGKAVTLTNGMHNGGGFDPGVMHIFLILSFFSCSLERGSDGNKSILHIIYRRRKLLTCTLEREILSYDSRRGGGLMYEHFQKGRPTLIVINNKC